MTYIVSGGALNSTHSLTHWDMPPPRNLSYSLHEAGGGDDW